MYVLERACSGKSPSPRGLIRQLKVLSCAVFMSPSLSTGDVPLLISDVKAPVSRGVLFECDVMCMERNVLLARVQEGVGLLTGIESKPDIMVVQKAMRRSVGCKPSRRSTVALLHGYHRTRHLTPTGARGPRLLWLLCAEFSESTCALSPLPALALALPVRLRTFLGGGPLSGYWLLTPACCST